MLYSPDKNLTYDFTPIKTALKKSAKLLAFIRFSSMFST